jgi:hypothetical protein
MRPLSYLPATMVDSRVNVAPWLYGFCPQIIVIEMVSVAFVYSFLFFFFLVVGVKYMHYLDY